MSDKDKIKEELGRRIVQAEEFAERAKGANDDSSKLSWDFVATQNKSLLQFIDSIQEQPISEDWEEAAKQHSKQTFNGILIEDNIDAFKAGSEWQRKKDQEIDKLTESPDLDEASWKYSDRDGITYGQRYAMQIDFKAGAKWQKQQMKETLQTEYEKGRFDMREEMMKNAVEGEVVYQIGSSIIAPTDIRYKVMSDRVYIPNVKLGDKVKIIICKTEQQ